MRKISPGGSQGKKTRLFKHVITTACFLVFILFSSGAPSAAMPKDEPSPDLSIPCLDDLRATDLSLSHSSLNSLTLLPVDGNVRSSLSWDQPVAQAAGAGDADSASIELPGNSGTPSTDNSESGQCTSELQKTYQTGPDWPGLRRDTYHILVYQAVSVGILYFLPESVTNWTEDQKNYSVEKWLERIGKIHWDNDSWVFNLVMHPYWGAGYYVRARERGFDWKDSFLYSVAMSSIYEFIIEAQFERPSIQDLIATPVVGSLAGSYFETVRGKIRAKESRRWYDDVLMVVTDPMGALNNLVDGLLGIGPKEGVKCALLHSQPSSYERKRGNRLEDLPVTHEKTGAVVGVEVSLDW